MVTYLLLVNALSFLFMLLDKQFARKQLYRIPEAVLLSSALCGGSVGAILGMLLCRHKTRKPRFSLGLPLILLLQIVLYSLITAYGK